MGELGDQIEARVDPALVGGNRDPVHIGHAEKLAMKHGNDDAALDDNLDVTEVTVDNGLPTQEELATLRRVPAKIPWRGKCSFDYRKRSLRNKKPWKLYQELSLWPPTG